MPSKKQKKKLQQWSLMYAYWSLITQGYVKKIHDVTHDDYPNNNQVSNNNPSNTPQKDNESRQKETL